MRTNRSPLTTLAAAFTAALLMLSGPADAAGANRYPPSQAGAPLPQVKGMPPELARNLANFDDLDFRVYTGPCTRVTRRTSSCTGPMATRRGASKSTSRT
jgi:hypothetical protein